MHTFGKRLFKTWSGLRDHYQKKPRKEWIGWAFRGVRDAEWELSSSLERAVVDRFEFGWQKMATYEKRTLRSFQRQAHNHAGRVPQSDDTMEWTALMQHHGAPTRLLDWSYSFYVAAYFAVESATPGEPCAVWAINYKWLHSALKKMHAGYKSRDSHVHLWDLKPRPGVFPVNPFVLNQRLTIQQGCFMAVGDVSRSFAENYGEMNPPLRGAPLERWTFVADKSDLRNAFAELHRMNITSATLFPGLDGFSRSLGALL